MTTPAHHLRHTLATGEQSPAHSMNLAEKARDSPQPCRKARRVGRSSRRGLPHRPSPAIRGGAVPRPRQVAGDRSSRGWPAGNARHSTGAWEALKASPESRASTSSSPPARIRPAYSCNMGRRRINPPGPWPGGDERARGYFGTTSSSPPEGTAPAPEWNFLGRGRRVSKGLRRRRAERRSHIPPDNRSASAVGRRHVRGRLSAT